MATMKIKKGDMVKVIAGKDKDKEGKVIAVNTKNNTVLVEGINMVTKHAKPSMHYPPVNKYLELANESSIRRDLLTFQTLCIFTKEQLPA